MIKKFANACVRIVNRGSPSVFSPAAGSSSGPSSDKPETHKHRSAGGSPLPPFFYTKVVAFFCVCSYNHGKKQQTERKIDL